MYSEQDPLSHFKRLQMGVFGFSQNETGVTSVAMENNIVGVVLFLLRCTFLVPSLKNTASTFLGIFLIQYLTI